jgi:hypothetical protein
MDKSQTVTDSFDSLFASFFSYPKPAPIGKKAV